MLSATPGASGNETQVPSLHFANQIYQRTHSVYISQHSKGTHVVSI